MSFYQIIIGVFAVTSVHVRVYFIACLAAPQCVVWLGGAVEMG